MGFYGIKGYGKNNKGEKNENSKTKIRGTGKKN
jgi:hypothetical protein